MSHDTVNYGRGEGARGSGTYRVSTSHSSSLAASALQQNITIFAPVRVCAGLVGGSWQHRASDRVKRRSAGKMAKRLSRRYRRLPIVLRRRKR